MAWGPGRVVRCDAGHNPCWACGAVNWRRHLRRVGWACPRQRFHRWSRAWAQPPVPMQLGVRSGTSAGKGREGPGRWGGAELAEGPNGGLALTLRCGSTLKKAFCQSRWSNQSSRISTTTHCRISFHSVHRPQDEQKGSRLTSAEEPPHRGSP